MGDINTQLPVRQTDGTNLTPIMDAVGRPGFQKITDGTNTMPTMDVAARAGFQKVTDGTNTAAVKAASTPAVATDPAIVVAISPNNSLTFTPGNPTVNANAVCDYATAASVAASGTSNHDYTVANTNFFVKSIFASASGRIKAELKTGPVASLTSKGVKFNSTADPNIVFDFPEPLRVPNTSTGTCRLVITNLESSSMDVYSTFIGEDV